MNSPSRYRPATSRDRRRVIIGVALYSGTLTAGGLLLSRYAWPAGFIVWFVLFVGLGLTVLVRWHASVTAYQCAACRHEFEITPMQDLLSPHMIETKYLRCPSCGSRSWAHVLMKDDTDHSSRS